MDKKTEVKNLKSNGTKATGVAKSVGGASSMGAEPTKPPTDGGPDDYEAGDHARTLVKAAEILNDPEKMKRVHKHIGHQKKSFKTIAQLKEYSNQLHAPGNQNDHDGDEV